MATQTVFSILPHARFTNHGKIDEEVSGAISKTDTERMKIHESSDRTAVKNIRWNDSRQ